MRMHVAIAVGTLALATGVAVGGCGDSGPDQGSRPATATERSETPKPTTRSVVDIATKLDSGNTSTADGPSICSAASELAIDLGLLGNGIDFVQVLASDGAVLGGCA